MNNAKAREEEIIYMIKNRLNDFSENLKGYKVILFGSRAAGTAVDRSDFDLGIMGNNKYPVKLFYELEDKLDDIPTLYELNLVDLNVVSEKFRQEALKNYLVLYE